MENKMNLLFSFIIVYFYWLHYIIIIDEKFILDQKVKF